MKYLLIFCSLFLFSQISCAGPFGLSMGMKLEELQILEDRGDGLYQITAPKPHRFFDFYIVTAGAKAGVCKITSGKTIETSVYGDELLAKFNDMEAALNKIYGKNVRYDYLKHDSIWDEQRDWMIGLLKKERTLAVFWSEKEGSDLKSNIGLIMLKAQALSREKGFIQLVYLFSNFERCEEEINQGEDEVL